MRQVFGRGFFVGGALASAMTVSKGRLDLGKLPAEPDAEQPLLRTGRAEQLSRRRTASSPSTSSRPSSSPATRRATTSRITSASSARCRATSRTSGCNMCPAQVYEIGTDGGDGTVTVNVAPSNCVQCGAITAKGGRLTPPEGGSGPEYTQT